MRLWKEVEFGRTLQLLQDSSREVRLIPRLLRVRIFYFDSFGSTRTSLAGEIYFSGQACAPMAYSPSAWPK